MRVLSLRHPLKEQQASSLVHAQQLWNEWEIQFLVLLSFSLQVFLLFFAVMRKRSTSSVLSVLLWLAYLSADYVAVFILGRLTFHVDNKPHQLVGFWAPFLLLHLGGPDTITAFSMEDNDLWKRHLLNLVSQVALVVYVAGKQWQHQDKQLQAAMVLMFISGTVKYAERTWALYRVGSSTHGSQSSAASAWFELSQDGLGYYHSLVDIISSKRERNFSALLNAAGFGFESVLDLFMDVSPSNSVRIETLYMVADTPKHFQSSEDRVHMSYRLVEIHLSLIYDYLYTKFGSRYANIMIAIGPICSTFQRLVSFVLTSVALVLFLTVDLTKYNGADVVVTYVLLIGAITLEVCSIFMGCISSYWSHQIIPGAWLWICCCCIQENCLEWSFRIFHSVVWRLHPKNRAQWSGNLAQYNLVGGCIQEKQAAGAGRWKKTLRSLGIKGDTPLVVAASPELKKMVLDKLLGVLATPRVKEWELTRFNGQWAQWAPETMHRESSTAARRALEVSCIQGLDFVSNAIIWHYTTDLCFFAAGEAGDNSELRATCMELSNYIMHLVAKHEVMVGSDGMYLLWKAEQEVQSYLNRKCRGVDYRNEFSHEMCHGEPIDNDVYAGLRQAQCVHKELLKIHEACHRWELIAAVWVEMLCYMAHNSGARFHAKHLSTGGEFITHVRMLLIILGLPFLQDLKKTIPYPARD